MDNFAIPPELMGMPPAIGPGAPMAGPPVAPEMGALGGDIGVETPGVGPDFPQNPFGQAPINPRPFGMPMAGGQDQVLAQMLQNTPELAPIDVKPARKPTPKPEEGFCQEIVFHDRQDYTRLLTRMARDLSLLRQHESGTPMDFDAERNPQFVSAAMSTLVNKFANMLSGPDEYYEVEYVDQSTEKAAQAVEDFAARCRRYETRIYATSTSGGNLKRDEFWHLLLHGRVVCRVLPDFDDPDYPFSSTLLDPATCFPVWGDGKEGLIRMSREYTSSLASVVTAYGRTPDMRAKVLRRLGYDERSFRENYHIEATVREYWDKDWRYVSWGGTAVLPVTRHHLGVVPFVYITAVGEPMSSHTPEGRYTHFVDEFGGIGVGVSRDMDQVEKGVSVFHYLVNTHRLMEAIHTIFLIEMEKARNPATITYSAPQLIGDDQEPLDGGIGGNNVRVMGLQKVEGFPTSPRPTDTAPLMQKTDQDFFSGSLPPTAFGDAPGTQPSGFSVQGLLAAAKDMVVPYARAWEMYQSLKLELKLRYYRELIAPVAPLTVGHKTDYGAGYEATKLTSEILDAVGTVVEVRLSSIGPAEFPQRVAAVVQAMSAGLYSQRHAMTKLEVRNPNKMFNEIMAERAMQHPMIQEMLIIPNSLIEVGMEDVAEAWAQLVIAPKVGQIGMAPPGAPGGEAPGGGGMGAPIPVGQGQNPSRPGGPAPGQGRGPAPQ